MEVQQDFRELLALLNKHEVDYVIVGAYAPGFHGVPRYTGALDIYVKPDPANAERIMRAFHEFGFGSIGLTAADFEEENKVVQLGVPPIRIGMMTSITGVSWEQARAGTVKGWFGELTVPYIGRDDLISNKRALGRKRDLADLEGLGED